MPFAKIEPCMSEHKKVEVSKKVDVDLTADEITILRINRCMPTRNKFRIDQNAATWPSTR